MMEEDHTSHSASCTLVVANEAEMGQFGSVLAAVLPPGCVVGLYGTLGAGKTRLVQAIAQSLGVAAGAVVSPTFVLLQHYEGKKRIHHFDAYRVRDTDEFLDLGPEEYFEGPGISLVEWADRVEVVLPPDRVEIHIEVTGSEERSIEIVGRGATSKDVVRRLSDCCGDFGNFRPI